RQRRDWRKMARRDAVWRSRSCRPTLALSHGIRRTLSTVAKMNAATYFLRTTESRWERHDTSSSPHVNNEAHPRLLFLLGEGGLRQASILSNLLSDSSLPVHSPPVLRWARPPPN